MENQAEGILTDDESKVILGVHDRDYNNCLRSGLPEYPSKCDLEVLNTAYKSKSMQSSFLRLHFTGFLWFQCVCLNTFRLPSPHLLVCVHMDVYNVLVWWVGGGIILLAQ